MARSVGRVQLAVSLQCIFDSAVRKMLCGRRPAAAQWTEACPPQKEKKEEKKKMARHFNWVTQEVNSSRRRRDSEHRNHAAFGRCSYQLRGTIDTLPDEARHECTFPYICLPPPHPSAPLGKGAVE
ncbi:uncharacterized protein Tco025E_05038 [Trypanosoma conorhini]|uniref:Uncharacterized protein n=1 Tax=Trypanosoma conorhini TaxID=83891 RepID=A0A422PGG7_9TRYP|nr:uncharacterized protein Tco025E_05038 [Trypanosoma conorhini]RNF16808.1 hypothetical protein Tco025E_05038 [Trypanosoma conorhini]